MRWVSRCRTSVRQDLTAAPLLRDPKLTLSGILCLTFSHMTTTFFYLIFFCSFFLLKDFCIRWPRRDFQLWRIHREDCRVWGGDCRRGDLKSLKLNPSVCSICSLCASPNGVCIIYCNTWLNAVEILLLSNRTLYLYHFYPFLLEKAPADLEGFSMQLLVAIYAFLQPPIPSKIKHIPHL